MLRPICATRRLAVIFIVTILTPGLILGIFGWRALLKERKLADQEIRERLNTAAQTIGRQLEFDLKEWQRNRRSAGPGRSSEPGSLAGIAPSRHGFNWRRGCLISKRQADREPASGASSLRVVGLAAFKGGSSFSAHRTSGVP
jgi:hypothetical protein